MDKHHPLIVRNLLMGNNDRIMRIDRLWRSIEIDAQSVAVVHGFAFYVS